jgi:hypothetical protein
MAPNVDDAPLHRLRLHPRARAASRHALPRAQAARPPEVWLYAALVATLALIAATRLFAIAHVH